MNTGDDRTLTQVLHRVAEEARPARLPPDLWSRGQRRQRRRVATATVITAVLISVLTAPVAFLSTRAPASPAQDQPSIPSRVLGPLPLQSTVQEAPGGPAALILTGPGGFGGNFLLGYDDRALVVGRNGSYRIVRHVDSFDAGESLLLSPGGRYVAGDSGVEGAAQLGDDPYAQTSVLDLTTGQIQLYNAGRPLAWSPDGHSLLASSPAGMLSVVGMDSGAVIRLGVYGGDPNRTRAAFSPDGHRVALNIGPTLRIVDIATRTYDDLVSLGDRRILAGPGAWTIDDRIAVWDLVDCETPCRSPESAGMVGFELTYVDAVRGAAVVGPRLMTVQATGASLLGWQSDGDAVVVLTRDMDPQVITPQGDIAVQVVALRPGGGSTDLIGLPSSANRIDVARDLLDRFGGPPISPVARFLDWLQPLLDEIGVLVALAAAIAAVVLVRRRMRTGVWRSPRTRHWAE